MPQAATYSFYDGALVYDAVRCCVCWVDGTPEPRVRIVPKFARAPRFRCTTRRERTYIEIPEHWEERFEWSGDADIRDCILDLIRLKGRPHPVYVEGSAELENDSRPMVDGWIIPLAVWETEMQKPCDLSFDPVHQLSLMRKIRQVQQSPRAFIAHAPPANNVQNNKPL